MAPSHTKLHVDELTSLRGLGRDDAQLAARTDALAQAVTLAGHRLDTDTAEHLNNAVAAVRQRLALGVDHTIVALAGGTGSGKSTLFNALTGLHFADVGVERPTTAQATAVSWEGDATPLLDWLQVDPDRRMVQHPELARLGEDLEELAGLVLLDLPDHDSVAVAHREVVDRITPLVDLLVWVVDPQKYADQALHGNYLASSADLQGAMVVVLNQIDTVPQAAREALVADLRSLLAGHGLDDVPVLAVSALTGEGLDLMRRGLAAACQRQTVSAGRAAGELRMAAKDLLAQVGQISPWRLELAVQRALPDMAAAAGLKAITEQVSDLITEGYGSVQRPPVDRDALSAMRTAWLTHAGASLPPRWQRSLGDAVATAETLRTETTAAMEALDVSAPKARRGKRRKVVEARVAEVQQAGEQALRQVLVRTLAGPTQAILAEYAQVRDLAAAALPSAE